MGKRYLVRIIGSDGNVKTNCNNIYYIGKNGFIIARNGYIPSREEAEILKEIIDNALRKGIEITFSNPEQWVYLFSPEYERIDFTDVDEVIIIEADVK